jgi:hypothetical protein
MAAEREPVSLLNLLKKVSFWNYARNTWQWDALCVVILIFIFLTPRNWWENSERKRAFGHQSPTALMLLVDAELVESAEDRVQLERRLRSVTGRPNLRVVNVRKLAAEDGRVKGYEVDIR